MKFVKMRLKLDNGYLMIKKQLNVIMAIFAINFIQEMNYFLMKEIIENYILAQKHIIVKKVSYVQKSMLLILK